MALRIGPKVKVKFARETAGQYGTGSQTVNRCIAVEECTFESKPQIAESPNMPAAGATAQPWMVDSAQSGLLIANELTDGTLTVPLDYEGLLQFFDMIYGTGTFGTYGATVTGGSAPYTHLFKEKEFLNSMQMEMVEGNADAGKVAWALGVKATDLTVSGTASPGEPSLLKLAMNFVALKKMIAQTPSDNASPITTTSTRIPIRMADLQTTGTDFGLGGETPILRAFTFSVKPAILSKQMQGGSTYIREPIRVGLIDTRLKLSLEYASDTAVTRLIAGTVASPSMNFTFGASGFAINFSKALLMSVSQPRPTLNDCMVQDLEWKAMWYSGFGASVQFINTQAGAAA